MVTISFIKNIPPIATSKNSNLMETLISAGVPVGSSCGGDGVCGKCQVKICQGNENLSPPTSQEEKHDLPDGLRLSCQCTITKEDSQLTVDADYW